jgi:hypothetical protein
VIETVTKVVSFQEEQQKAVNETLLNNTKPAKTKLECAASRMPSTVRIKYFNCAQVDLLVELVRLKSYGDEQKSEMIFAEVCRYSAVMLDRDSRGEKDEKKYVQPEIRDYFWVNTRGALVCSTAVELSRERPFHMVMEDEDNRSIITGFTDHTVKLCSCDFHALTIEDKALGLAMDKSDRAQAQCEMVEELREMNVHLQYVPLEYCGILQNGKSWIFLFRKVRHGREMWNYVVAPDTFADGALNEDNCRIVARLVEHAYCVVDDIVRDITTPKMSVPVSSLTGGGDSGGDEDGDGDGDDDSEEGSYDEAGGHQPFLPAGRDAFLSAPASTQTRGVRGKTKHTTLHCYGDENFFLPFTMENVMKQPVHAYKLVL